MIGAFVRANPALFATALLLVTATGVGLVLVLLMRQAGSSLRPLAFVYGFFGIILVPQFIYHLTQMRWPGDAGAAGPQATATARAGDMPTPQDGRVWDHRDGHFLHPDRLFGADADPALTREARQIFPDFLGRAEAAEMAMFGTGDTALAARFAGPDEAAAAVRGYLAFFGVEMAGGDLTRGLRARRGTVSDMAEILLAGNSLMVWTAQDTAALDRRRNASDLGPSTAAPGAGASAESAGGGFYVDPRLNQPGFLIFLVLNVIAAVVWFFKGAVWATGLAPDPGVEPVPLAELSRRLRDIGSLDVPMQVKASADGSEITLDWRYADARWVDHARAHAMRRTHRLVLRLEESGHRARVREYWSTLDASAGADAARLQWQAARGLVFYQKEHQRVFGLQLDGDGRPKADMSYAYTFDLQELRQPLIRTVTGAGWIWQPVLVDAPPALRWLTE